MYMKYNIFTIYYIRFISIISLPLAIIGWWAGRSVLIGWPAAIVDGGGGRRSIRPLPCAVAATKVKVSGREYDSGILLAPSTDRYIFIKQYRYTCILRRYH